MGNLVKLVIAGCLRSGTNYPESADPQGVVYAYEDDNSGTTTAVKGAAPIGNRAVSNRSGRSH